MPVPADRAALGASSVLIVAGACGLGCLLAIRPHLDEKHRDEGEVAGRTDLESAAASGIRLPRESASFSPEPHPGLVFRTLDDQDDQ